MTPNNNGERNEAILDDRVAPPTLAANPVLTLLSLATPNDQMLNGTSKPLLLPQHRADLAKSGLSETQIAKCGFRSLTEKIAIQDALRWRSYSGSLGPCLLIPFVGPDGKSTEYRRLKPDRPRKKKGKVVKYESPISASNRVFFPPGTLSTLADPSQPLILTEGEKKAAKADQEGFPCLGLVGVYGWQKKRIRNKEGRGRGERELIPDLAGVTWGGRQAFIIYDSDVTQKPEVQWAEWHLSEELARNGAGVKVVHLPEGPAGPDGKPAKMGLDDYLVAHGADALRALLTQAKVPEPPARADDTQTAVNGQKPWESLTDPHLLARQLIANNNHPDRPRITYFRQQFWVWNGSRHIAVPDAEFRGQLANFAKAQIDEVYEMLFSGIEASDEKSVPSPEAPKITTALVSNVWQALSGQVMLSELTPVPSWIGEGDCNRQYIAVRNGLLDVAALFAGRNEVMIPHTPLWFSPVCLPYPFDPDARYPHWKRFLDRNLEGEFSPKAVLLQEFFGYCLLIDLTLQKFLIMVGDGANGKSVVCAALRAVLGDDNVSSVPLELFGDKFRLAGTLGKLANITAEVGELDRVAEGQLKSYISGDLMEFEKKFKQPFSARPTARLVLATNNMPSFSDKSDGLWRRMLLIKFTTQIPASDQIAGMDTPEWWQSQGEQSGILNWAIAGLHRLRQQGRFTFDQELQQDVNAVRVDSNPAKRFLLEHYRKGPGEVRKKDVYSTYQEWCQSNGHHPLASNKFAMEVFRQFPDTKDSQPTLEGRRVRTFAGLERVYVDGEV